MDVHWMPYVCMGFWAGMGCGLDAYGDGEVM